MGLALHGLVQLLEAKSDLESTKLTFLARALEKQLLLHKGKEHAIGIGRELLRHRFANGGHYRLGVG